MNLLPPIIWNRHLRLVFSDVDETIAEVYTPADPEMIVELSSYLVGGGKLFMVTGGSLTRVRRDITDYIVPKLRRNILISHCSGAEVWGFTKSGDLLEKPFYSIYEDIFTTEMKKKPGALLSRSYYRNFHCAHIQLNPKASSGRLLAANHSILC